MFLIFEDISKFENVKIAEKERVRRVKVIIKVEKVESEVESEIKSEVESEIKIEVRSWGRFEEDNNSTGTKDSIIKNKVGSEGGFEEKSD